MARRCVQERPGPKAASIRLTRKQQRKLERFVSSRKQHFRDVWTLATLRTALERETGLALSLTEIRRVLFEYVRHGTRTLFAVSCQAPSTIAPDRVRTWGR